MSNDILNEQQTNQLVDYVPNFAALLHDAGFSREQAADAIHSSIACIFATIWKLPTDSRLSDKEREFVLSLQVHTLRMFYGQEESK